MVQFGMRKDAPPVFRVQMMPKDLPKLSEELRAKLRSHQPIDAYQFPEAK